MNKSREAHLNELNEILLDPDGRRIIRIGDMFTATDTLRRTFKYQYLGIQDDCCGYDIYLHTENPDSFINVELEWFNQRKIVILEQGDNVNENEDENENGTEDR